jgi:CelD/BcsL family acetyltransferase involved in cellulose biosynthesis/peptidoglycan/xylan/chitin deacetylase (PgdA/CDA1 family)
VRIERITSKNDFHALRGEWNALVQRSSAETVFLTWEWLTSWWAAYGTGKELFVLVARDESGECCGIAPLYLVREGWTRVLRFIGDGTYDSDYLDFIVARGHETSLLPAIFDYLNQVDKCWDALQLNEIPETSLSLAFLRDLKDKSRWLLQQEQVPAGLRGLPSTWEEFLQTLKPRFRTSVRACLRNLEQWKGAFEVLTSEADISPWLADLYELHSERWSLRQQSGVFAKASKRDFYERMAHNFFRRGWLHMTRWRLEGIVLATQFGFVYGGTYHLLQEGFDTRCIHVSPGVTLRAATIRDLIARGVHTYDFLGGIGRHKTDWGANEKKSVRLALASRSVPGYIYVELPPAIQNVKDRVKRALPETLLQKLKRSPATANKKAPVGAIPESAGENGASWKEKLGSGLHRSGLLRVIQSISRRYEVQPGSSPLLIRCQKTSAPKFVILCYHRVGSGGVPLYSGLPPQVFEAQMEFLSNRYRVVSLETLTQELSQPGPAEQSVVITFDDGYRDVYTHAFPVLQKYRIPATIYLTVDVIESNSVAWYDRIFLALGIAPGEKLDVRLDRPRRFLLSSPAARLRAAEEIISYLRTVPNEARCDFCRELEKLIPLPTEDTANRMLTWEQIQQMQRGRVSFGSHTLSHPAISRLNPAALDHELRESKARLEEKLGAFVGDFAYPFGKPADYGNTPDAVARCGYRTASTTNWGINTPGVNLHELKRVSIGEERRLSAFAVRLAQLFLSAETHAPAASQVTSATKKAAKEEDVVCSSN